MTLQVHSKRQDGEMQCEPTVLEAQNIISRCFDLVIRVAHRMPGIQNILFPEIKRKQHLCAVYRREKDVRQIKKKKIIFI